MSTVASIFFEDEGQSFTQWNLDKNGFVTESLPKGTETFKGCKVEEGNAVVGHQLVFLNNDHNNSVIMQRVEAIIRH